MRKIFTINIFLMAFLLSFSFYPIFASNETESQNDTYTSQNNQNDITKPGYKIDLQKMNPVASSQTANASSNYSGKGAALFLLNRLSYLLLFIIPIIAGVAFIIAGYYYVLSGGDTEKTNIAKRIIQWNLIAVLIALFSYALIKMIAMILGGRV